MSKVEPLLCWSQNDDPGRVPARVVCSQETSVDMFKNDIEHLNASSSNKLVIATLECVEEPEWLLDLLQRFCQSQRITAICNVKVIQPSTQAKAHVFDLDVSGFVRSYCSPRLNLSIDELSKLGTIRAAPNECNPPDLTTLKSSLLAGWRQDQVAICSSDRSLLLDGATRVFVLKGMYLDGLSVPTELPVVNCLSHTPAWIINQILVLLSQIDEFGPLVTL